MHVDSVNIFRLLDEIISQRRNNYIREFEKFDDISSWLKDQWAGLFAELLTRTSGETSLRGLASQVSELGNVTSVLKEYTESIMRKVQPEESKVIILREEKKLRNQKQRRLREEDMIRFIIEHYKLSMTKIYSAMERSNEVEEFLKMAGLRKSDVGAFISEHERIARRDFEHLKTRYFRNDEIDFLEEEKDD